MFNSRFFLVLTLALFGAAAQADSYYLTNGIVVKYGQHGQNLAACYSCKVCHGTIVPDPANPQITQFGNAWLTAWKAREPARVTDQQIDTQALMAFDDIANQDADSDGVSNVNEINGDANPNDPASTPGNTGCTLSTGTISGGGTNGSMSLGSNAANANMLNSKCGFSSGAGLVNAKIDPVHVVVNSLLYLLPVLLLAALRLRARVKFP